MVTVAFKQICRVFFFLKKWSVKSFAQHGATDFISMFPSLSTVPVKSQGELFMPKKQRQEDVQGFLWWPRAGPGGTKHAHHFMLLSWDIPYAVTLNCPGQLLQFII